MLVHSPEKPKTAEQSRCKGIRRYGFGMRETFYRTAMLLGEDAENILLESKAAVFGVGGVGGHCVDALVRCGLGRIAIFDSAKVKPSNLNRQICAKNPP